MTGTKPRADTPPGFTSVTRVSSTQQVRDQLLHAIERGDYAPGSALPSERALCASFGVSRVSVREAIAGLVSTGLVRVEHGRGVFVRESAHDAYAGPFARYLEANRDELVELLKVRGALDELAAVEAIEHGDESAFSLIDDANSAFQRAAGADSTDTRRTAELDATFHMSIAHASRGKLLPRLLEELNGVMEESRIATLSRPGQLATSAREHTAIVDALNAHDTSAARRAVRAHIDNVLSWVSRFPNTAD